MLTIHYSIKLEQYVSSINNIAMSKGKKTTKNANCKMHSVDIDFIISARRLRKTIAKFDFENKYYYFVKKLI